MMSTVMVATSVYTDCSTGPKLYQAKKVSTATSNTVGTNTAEIRSARRPMAGLAFCAWRTISIICASAVSLPMRVAL